MTFALFQDSQQISKPHSTKIAAVIEDFEKGAVIRCGRVYELVDGYEVRALADTGAQSSGKKRVQQSI